MKDTIVNTSKIEFQLIYIHNNIAVNEKTHVNVIEKQ